MKERYKRLVLFVVCLAFFIVAHECTAQGSYPSQPMRFEVKGGAVYVNARTDVWPDTTIHRIFALFTSKNKAYDLKISFCNGDIDVIPAVRVKNGFNEYELTAEIIQKLSRYRFDAIYFDSPTDMIVCNDIKRKDFFIKHFNN